MNGIKYALLLLPTIPPRDENPGVREIVPDIITWRGLLSELIELGEVQHWKKWLGDIEWREMNREQRFVLSFMSSEHAEVSDAESKQLRARAMLAWYATLLVSPVRHSMAFVVSSAASRCSKPAQGSTPVRSASRSDWNGRATAIREQTGVHAGHALRS